MPLKDVLDIGQELIGYGATFRGVREKEPAQKMRDLLNHPDFNKLSQAGQIQYFGKIFPDFANLSPGEFQQVRNRAAESPLINAGAEGATNLLAGEMGGKLAGEALSAAAPALGKAGGVAEDIGRSLLPKRFLEARAARKLQEDIAAGRTRIPATKAPPLKPNIPEKEPPKGATPAPPLRPNIPERLSKPRMSQAPPLKPNVSKTAQEVGRTTTPAPPLRPNVFPKEREVEEGTEAVLTKPKVSAPKAKESPTPKANAGTTPKASSDAGARILNKIKELGEKGPISTSKLRRALPELSKEEFDAAALELQKSGKAQLSLHSNYRNLSEAEKAEMVPGGMEPGEVTGTPYQRQYSAIAPSKPDDLASQLKASLENPKAKPAPPAEPKPDYTKTDKYAKDKAAKNEQVVSYLQGKGIGKKEWRDASLDQKNKWIRDAVGSKHREYREGEEKAATRTKEIEDLLSDSPKKEPPKSEPLSAPRISSPSMEGFAKDDPLPSLIKKTARDLAGNYDTRVQISDLKRALSNYPSEQIDKTLRQMQTNGDMVLFKNDDPIDISAADRKAALKIGGEPRHLIYMHERTRVSPPAPKVETPKVAAPQPKEEPSVSKPKVSSPQRAGLERPPGWEKGPADKYFKFDISRRAGEEPYVHWDEGVPLPERLSEAQLAKAQELINMVNKRSPGLFQGIQDRLNNVKDAQGRFGTPEDRKRDIHELLHSVNPEMSKRILEAK